jgi:hypothetical protein
MKVEASVDPQCGGPDWTPITPKTGSLFHAETHLSEDAMSLLMLGLFLSTILALSAVALNAGDGDGFSNA